MDLYICKNTRTVVAIDDSKQATEYHMQDVSRGILVREDCNLIIDGKTIKANKGDLIIGMYSPKDRYDIKFLLFLELTLVIYQKQLLQKKPKEKRKL